jgi:hypothetical protein
MPLGRVRLSRRTYSRGLPVPRARGLREGRLVVPAREGFGKSLSRAGSEPKKSAPLTLVARS